MLNIDINRIFPCGTKDIEQECLANARLVYLYSRNFGQGQWSLIGLGSEKKWSSFKEHSPQGLLDKIAEMLFCFLREDVQFSVLRNHCPDFNSKTVDTLCGRSGQLSLYGAVANMCEEYEPFHKRTVRPVVVGQSSFDQCIPSSSTFSKVQRDDDGAVQFWRIKEHLQSQFLQILFGLTIDIKHVW